MFKIAMLPLDICWDLKNVNISALEASFSTLDSDTDLLVLPETFATGFPVDKTRKEIESLAETDDGLTMSAVRKLAAERDVAICGSFIAKDGDGLHNRAFFTYPDGHAVFADKRHLFSMAGENRVFEKGDSRLSVVYKGWNIAMIICYDIRFPVWCRNVDNGYDLLVVVANWPSVRIDAWNRLLPARAIENLAYVCGVDCAGTDSKGFSYDGSSEVYDYKGKPLADCRGNQLDFPFIYAELSLEKLKAFRDKFPAWRDADGFVLTHDSEYGK